MGRIISTLPRQIASGISEYQAKSILEFLKRVGNNQFKLGRNKSLTCTLEGNYSLSYEFSPEMFFTHMIKYELSKSLGQTDLEPPHLFGTIEKYPYSERPLNIYIENRLFDINNLMTKSEVKKKTIFAPTLEYIENEDFIGTFLIDFKTINSRQ